MEVTLKQIFSLTDGRLSTGMDDVYSMLNEAMDDDLTTIALPMASDKVKQANPKWFKDAVLKTNEVKKKIGNDFNELMEYMDLNCQNVKFTITSIR